MRRLEGAAQAVPPHSGRARCRRRRSGSGRRRPTRPSPAQSRQTVPPTAERPVALPSPLPTPTASALPAEAAAAPPARGLVLVVDDSPTVLKVVEFELRKHRLDVVTAADGCDALSRLHALTPDLVLARYQHAADGRLPGVPRDPRRPANRSCAGRDAVGQGRVLRQDSGPPGGAAATSPSRSTPPR